MEKHAIPGQELDLLRSLCGRFLDEFWIDDYTAGLQLGDQPVVLNSVSLLNEGNRRDWYELFRLGVEREEDPARFQSITTAFHKHLGVIREIRLGTSVVAEWSQELDPEILPRLRPAADRTAHLDDHGLDSFVTHPDCREDVAVLEKAGVALALVPVGVALVLDNAYAAVCFTTGLSPMVEGWLAPAHGFLFTESSVRWATLD